MSDENVGLTGQVFAHASAVTNAAANEIAEFRGGWSAEIAETFAEWFGQSTVRKGATLTQYDIILTVDELAFKPGNLDKLWNITKNGSDNLKSVGAEAATSYTFTSSIAPRALQYLIECQLDGKTYQAYAPTAYINSSTINFTNQDYVVQNCPLLLYGATGTLCEFFIEN